MHEFSLMTNQKSTYLAMIPTHIHDAHSYTCTITVAVKTCCWLQVGSILLAHYDFYPLALISWGAKFRDYYNSHENNEN